MNTHEIAIRLAELCTSGEFEKAQMELYGDDVVSIEPQAMPGYDRVTKGKNAVLGKIRKFMETMETGYGNKVSTPLIAGSAIAFTLTMDVKMKGQDRMAMDELCVYETKDGKVVSEQFFW